MEKRSERSRYCRAEKCRRKKTNQGEKVLGKGVLESIVDHRNTQSPPRLTSAETADTAVADAKDHAGQAANAQKQHPVVSPVAEL